MNWRIELRPLSAVWRRSTLTAAQRPDGQVVNFTLTGSTWTPDKDMDYTLTSSGSTWTLTDPDDTVGNPTPPSGSLATLQFDQAAQRLYAVDYLFERAS